MRLPLPLLFVCQVACQARASPLFQVQSSEALCADAERALIDHRRILFDFLQLPEDGRTVRVRVTKDDEATECAAARACWNSETQTIVTQRMVDQHELVHAYLDPLGTAPALLAEGIAVALDSEELPGELGSDTRDVALDDLIAWKGASDRLLYRAAGALIGETIRRRGVEDFLLWYRRSIVLGAADAYAEVYGEPLREQWLRTIAASERGRTWPLPVWECERDAYACAGGEKHTQKIDKAGVIFSTPGMLLVSCANHWVTHPQRDELLVLARETFWLPIFVPLQPSYVQRSPWHDKAFVRWPFGQHTFAWTSPQVELRIELEEDAALGANLPECYAICSHDICEPFTPIHGRARDVLKIRVQDACAPLEVQ